MKKGKIVSIIAGIYKVILEDKIELSVSPKGLFRYQNIKPTVGDDVIVKDGMIVEILPRKNILIRPSISNIDLGIVVMSMKQPDYSSFLLDKFLTLLYMNNIEPVVVLTKCDLIKDEDLLDKIIEEYSSIGIKIIKTSKVTLMGIDELKKVIKGKTIAFTGQTGAGKSSLINMINSSFERKEGEYSKALKRGKHQTKEVILLPFNDGFIADTPGFSSLELKCYKEELKNYFPFFKNIEENCYYQDCMHIKEPNCAILKKVNNDEIFKIHYDNYKQLFDELIYRKDRFNK